MVNLVEHPGAFRFEDVHLPRFKNYRALPPQEVPDAFRALVARWHQEWGKRDPIGLATDVLWQLIKLQPFVDGNKRIARMAAYFVLNRCFGQVLQGSNTMLVQIERDPSEFYDALWFAFETDSLGQANTGKLEDMVGRYVKRQLESAAPRER
ncbi:MAG: Fic family protein [Pseudomonadaceae bacterium]|nr:Fic family protein [Pseudomonadaceae bacterium]